MEAALTFESFLELLEVKGSEEEREQERRGRHQKIAVVHPPLQKSERLMH